VDFERGLNTSIKELRHSLGDSARNPRYIETIPKLGYRFVAVFEAEPVGHMAPESDVRPATTDPPQVVPRQHRGWLYSMIVEHFR
jgi:DNA-binding winged helix-turn-helix (wHTH) protein